MAPSRKSTETIAALLSTAPALAPADDEPARPSHGFAPSNEVGKPVLSQVGGGNLAVQSPEVPVTASDRPVAVSPDDYDEIDLEAFELEVDRPLVRPRRRREVDYQTVRINKPTARILRQCWLAARSIDPLVSFTEFATIVTQKGLRTLAEERSREDPNLFD